MSRVYNIEMAVGDEKPDIVMTVRDGATNTAVDLTDADSVTFYLYDLEGDTAVIEGNTASIVSPATGGKVKYVWDTGASDETDTPGRYAAWFVIYWAAGPTKPQTTSAIQVTIKQPYERLR